jgi:hypothetical protein
MYGCLTVNAVRPVYPSISEIEERARGRLFETFSGSSCWMIAVYLLANEKSRRGVNKG